MSENKRLSRKNGAKPSQSAHFDTFFFKKPLNLLKNENKCSYKLNVFTMKSALGNMSENSEFRFENSHNVKK